MTLVVRPFARVHVAGARIQPSQPHYQALLTPESLAAVEGTRAWSVFRGADLLAVGGVIDLWPGRAAAWAIFTDAVTPRDFCALDRIARRGIARLFAEGLRRLEADIDPTFPQAVRWARLLGFAEEGLMRRYTADGRDMLRVARLAEA